MDLGKSFGICKEIAEEGKWFEMGPEARLKIRSIENEDFLDYVREHNIMDDDIVADTEAQADVGLEAVAKYILVDWENVKVDGDEIDYSVDMAKEQFEEFPRFFQKVLEIARDNKNFQEQKEDKENLSDGSDGS